MMGLTIYPITEDEVTVIQNLFEFAVYDLSELNMRGVRSVQRELEGQPVRMECAGTAVLEECTGSVYERGVYGSQKGRR